MRNVYIDTKELEDLLDNLKPTEVKLYNYLLGMVLKNPSPEDFNTVDLAKALQCSEGTIKNSRATLTKQGYIRIKKFKDESGMDMVRVVIGKEQVELYDLGLRVEIRDAKAYKELVELFDFTNPTRTPEDRQQRINDANLHYLKRNQNG